MQPEPVAWVAAALMTAGLLAKTALFPLHLWLPPAHAGAPPAASAVLSALVVKGSFVLLVRLWFEVMPALWSVSATQLIAALGAAAILYGSVLALRQERLKLLIAYSTVAQIGYLFLMFPLAFDPAAARLQDGVALTGGVLQTVSHAFAKAGMFMAAGLIAKSLGHDRIADLAGVGRALPMSLIAFGLAGVSLVGLPPSGGFAAKWLLLSAAVSTGQWWWARGAGAGRPVHGRLRDAGAGARDGQHRGAGGADVSPWPAPAKRWRSRCRSAPCCSACWRSGRSSCPRSVARA